MQQFRNLPILVSSSDVQDSNRLPRPQPVIPRWGVFPPSADAISGSIRPTDDTLYETSVMRILDEITERAAGRLLLSLLPTRYPVLIRKMTEKDIKRLGECNAETRFAQELVFSGYVVRGYVDIAFTPNASFSCVGRGPGTQPHVVLFHELVHAYENATHGRHVEFPITGEVGKYFQNTAEFSSILVTNMYISETSPELRFHHMGHARLPAEYATSSGYLKMK